MKKLQPFLATLTLVLSLLVFSALSPAGAATPVSVIDLQVSASMELADSRGASELLPFRNCPCPSEQEEAGCNLDLCGSGILNGKPPERSPLAALPHPLPADDLTGIVRQPEHSPPRSSV